jgi:hypothetical protein
VVVPIALQENLTSLLIRQALHGSCEVSGILRTATAHCILRDIFIRLLARVVVNHREEAIAAFSLTIDGRMEVL